MPPASSQIDGQRVAAFFVPASFPVLLLEVSQRPHVRTGQIVHMNVVADAGAVRSRVVGTVDLQLGRVRRGGGQRQWNQVSFGAVHLADLAAVVFAVFGSRGVEIAEAHRA